MTLKTTILVSLAGLYYCSAYAQVSADTIASADSIKQSQPVAPSPSAQVSLNAAMMTPPPAEDAGDEVYKLKPIVDIPLTVVTAGWSGFAFTKIYNKDKSTEQEINDLKESDIPKFDRWAAGMTDEKADMVSDYLFYGSLPYAFTVMLDKDIRQDALKVSFLYLEAMSITGLFYTGSVFLVDRYRPETYNTNLPMDERRSGNNKDAFIGGHPALVATSTFFAAKVYSDYHPDSKLRYAFYGVAIAATGTTAYLRHLAGKHFPTDLLAGMTVGTLSGILVPHLHKNKNLKDRKLGLYPFYNGYARGMTAVYSFK